MTLPFENKSFRYYLLFVLCGHVAFFPTDLSAVRFLSPFGDVAEANTPGSGVYTRACPANNSLNEVCYSDSGFFSMMTSANPWDSLYSGSDATVGGFTYFSGQAIAATNAGALRAQADANFQNYPGGNFSPGSTDPPAGYAAAALAWVTEDIVIRGPVGGTGLLLTPFRLTGQLSSTWQQTDGDPFLIMQGCADVVVTQGANSGRLGGGGHCAYSGHTIAIDYLGVHQPSISQQFLFNVPIRISVALSAAIYPVDYYANPDSPRSDLATSNFFSTLTIAPLLVTNLSGQPIPDLTIESASGGFTLDTRNQTNDVPEPRILAMLIAGMLLGIARFRRTRR